MTESAPLHLVVSCGVFAPHAGGAESLMRDLCGELVRRGHQATVVTRRLPKTSASEVLDGICIERFRFPLPYEAFRWSSQVVARSPFIFWRLWRLLRTRRVQTVVIGLLDMSVLYLLALRRLHGFRLVLFLHGGETRDLPEWSPTFRRLLVRCLSESDRIVAVSAELADDAAKHLPDARDRIEVIPNGIDIRAIGAAEPEDRERPYMLVAGRLVSGKRVDIVIEAFAARRKELPEVQLVVVGAGPERSRLEALVSDLGLPAGSVDFLGATPRHRVFSLMKGALFLIIASESEGHSIVALEAGAAGKLVLAARSPGLRESMTEGVEGFFFPPGDVEALGQLMLRLADAGAEVERRSMEQRLRERDPASRDIRLLTDRHLAVIADR